MKKNNNKKKEKKKIRNRVLCVHHVEGLKDVRRGAHLVGGLEGEGSGVPAETQPKGAAADL